ncbi:MAG TPA: RNA polymerase sigma factor RpoD/SigA [Candidatus Krumholzibacteria bacterium]|nr:RNA polymerase sigma factor RpoD/SigA [Candidatus Krumholzibacteria bacterium]HRX51127.1 RNA polymerase sigma factor RpoD/SigA [Candidatus Krumholzibacteria bacterium]
MAKRNAILPPTHEKSLEVYFREINRFSLLTREQEADLARRIREGDQDALKTLVNANLRFVVTVAKRYLHQGLTLADLINEGNIGLLKAAGRFDETRGFKFISYAVWWIRQSILQALLDHSRLVRLPQNQTALLLKINRARSLLQSEGIENPNSLQLARETGLEVSEVRRVLALGGAEVGLDDQGTGDRPLVETLAADHQPGPEARLYDRVMREDVRRSLEALSDREAVIISLYYGLEDDEAMTLEAIGQQLGLTRERIRQIKEKALRKMRQSAGKEILKDYA